MFEMLFENFRKASESSLEMQQELFKQWTQQWLSVPGGATVPASDWGRTLQKRWSELIIEALNKHREALDSSYRSGIQVIEETFRTAEAKTAEDYRRMVEELWRKVFEIFKSQSETQMKDFQSWAEKSMEAQRAAA